MGDIYAYGEHDVELDVHFVQHSFVLAGRDCWSLETMRRRPRVYGTYWKTLPRCMRLLPLSVQLLYEFDIYFKGGAEHDLLDMTLQPGVGVAALHSHLHQVRNHQ